MICEIVNQVIILLSTQQAFLFVMTWTKAFVFFRKSVVKYFEEYGTTTYEDVNEMTLTMSFLFTIVVYCIVDFVKFII